MSRAIMLVPTEVNVDLTSVSLGVVRAIEKKGILLNIFKPVYQARIYGDSLDHTTTIIHKKSSYSTAEPLNIDYVKSLLSNNQKDILMEEIIINYYIKAKDVQVVLVEGLIPNCKYQFIQSLNYEIAKTLNAEIVFVMSHNNDTLDHLKERIGLTYNSFGGTKNTNITGIIINKLDSQINEQNCIYSNFSKKLSFSSKEKVIKMDLNKLRDCIPLPIFGAIPWKFDLFATRSIDIARYLHSTILNEGDINIRYIKSITFCTSSISHMLKYFKNDSLLVTSVHCSDMIIAICLSVMNGVKISAILLTDGYKIDTNIKKLCEHTFTTGLPVFIVNTNIWQTFTRLQSFISEVSFYDKERIEKIQEYVANYINSDWIESIAAIYNHGRLFSPPAFRYQLTELARKANKRIVLPEGSEPRTVKAAAICAKRGIATCILLGNHNEINQVAASLNIKLSTGVEIIDPNIVRENYVTRLVELRKNKGMNEAIARKQLEDNVVLGTLMLEKNEVDGLVSGAIHTTANTIRPPLQLIKTAPGSSLISSVFFMLFPKQVYIYGDCAINPNPTAEQLAEIAIQSAGSAITFGIEPRVAMISYSTGTSGVGIDVEKVRKATFLAQKKRPDLIIDGPLQYDAAVIDNVAKLKAPNSPVAGHANVFIFPDLNTGNTTYKAVQRSAELISIGPILQGMRKPVNDLSRGALVDDIVYTIALTAVQSTQ